jgi:hypothetical protein
VLMMWTGSNELKMTGRRLSPRHTTERRICFSVLDCSTWVISMDSCKAIIPPQAYGSRMVLGVVQRDLDVDIISTYCNE